MKIPCDVIQDLLPMYTEKMTTAQSNALIEEHLADCRKCSLIFEAMKTDEKSVNVKVRKNSSIDLVRNSIRKRKRRACIFVSLVVFLIVFTIFFHLTKPIYVSFQRSGAEVVKTEEKEIYVKFSDNVTSCEVTSCYIDNQHIKEVVAWTSVWDKILGNTTPYALLSSYGEKTDTVYYCDYSKEQDNMTVIYGNDPNTDGGIIALPRLFLGYYFTMASAGAALIGLVWLILRKKQKASVICKYLFFIPASYLLGSIVLSTRFVSFSASRDFVIILIASAAIYGICITGSALIKQFIADRTL